MRLAAESWRKTETARSSGFRMRKMSEFFNSIADFRTVSWPRWRVTVFGTLAELPEL